MQHSYFQVSSEKVERVQVRALAEPLKDIQRRFPMPLKRCLGCMLRVVVLLEGEPSPQSERSGAGSRAQTQGTTDTPVSAIADELKAVINDLGPHKVFALVAGNVVNMKAELSKVEESYPHITAIGCNAHASAPQ